MGNGAQLFDVKGKVALITGATGYLGTAIAVGLAEAGAHVLINSRSRERCDELVTKLRNEGHSAEAAVFDVTKPQEIERYFALDKGATLNILINNAYVGGAGNIELSDSDGYLSSYQVTMLAAHNLFKAALPALRRAAQEKGDASVINIASMYALVSPDQRIYDSPEGANPPYYGVAKAGLLQWTRYAACEFGKENIRVNAISPGPFPSAAVRQKSPEFIEKLAQKVPMGRIGVDEEIKGPVLFLASPASSYVNGSNIVVDGGWTCW